MAYPVVEVSQADANSPLFRSIEPNFVQYKDTRLWRNPHMKYSQFVKEWFHRHPVHSRADAKAGMKAAAREWHTMRHNPDEYPAGSYEIAFRNPSLFGPHTHVFAALLALGVVVVAHHYKKFGA